MDINDFRISLCNSEITEIIHNDYPDDTDFDFVDEERQLDILDIISAFVNGETEDCKIWSDYDFDEPSENVFLAVYKYSSLVHPKLLENIESLIKFLWDKDFNVYEIIIDNNLH